MYVNNSELVAELDRCVEAGELLDGFATLAIYVATGHIANKYRYFPHWVRDEFQSDFQLRLVKGWQKIDRTKNIHAYICRTADFAALTRIRGNKRYGVGLAKVSALVKNFEERI